MRIDGIEVPVNITICRVFVSGFIQETNLLLSMCLHALLRFATYSEGPMFKVKPYTRNMLGYEPDIEQTMNQVTL